MKRFLQLITSPLPYRTYRYNVTTILIVVSIFVFLLTSAFPQLSRFLFLNLRFFLNGYVWTLGTYMFMHGDVSHILFNMLGLYFFGTVIERAWGGAEFLVLYLVTGILSGFISIVLYALTSSMQVILVGASGALFGVLLVFACLYPNAYIYIFGVIPVRARVLMLIYLGIQVYSLFFGAGGNVAYLTHVSGVLVAWIYLFVRHNINAYHQLFRRY